MVSQTVLALRATLAAPPLQQVRERLGIRLGAVLRGLFAQWIDGPPAVYGDADASVVFMIRDELASEAYLLRRYRA